MLPTNLSITQYQNLRQDLFIKHLILNYVQLFLTKARAMVLGKVGKVATYNPRQIRSTMFLITNYLFKRCSQFRYSLLRQSGL